MLGAVPQRRWHEGDIYHLERQRAINTTGGLPVVPPCDSYSMGGKQLPWEMGAGRRGGSEDLMVKVGRLVGRGGSHASYVCHYKKYLNYTIQAHS